MSYQDQAARTLALLSATPDWRRVRDLRPDLDDATVTAIVEEAAAFAEGVLAPLNTVADRIGCTVSNGRVVTPDGYGEAFRQFAEAGWLGMDVAEEHGGMGLPLAVQSACEPLFDRACVALMMAAGASRAACHLLASTADAATKATWIPKLVAGDWAATICISEPEAGSDVGRIRTVAREDGGIWRISGQKIWISFGDHDMTARIGHCLLARTNAAPGTRGLSLFLAPDRLDDGSRNGVVLERIEEKMGLHGSPTCALRFEDAEGILLGAEGRGLSQLFAMIEHMRLQSGGQGLALASAACDIAEAYAAERRQGGAPDRPAPPIASHPDVIRQLALMRARTEVVRAGVTEIAAAMDRAAIEPDAADRERLGHFTGFMLPLIKNFGAEAGFNVASAGIQVLGGVGFTKDWPLEQYLRDSRIISIYEGTTGIQAIDLLTRRIWRDGGIGFDICLERARAEIEAATVPEAARAREALATIDALRGAMMELAATPEKGLERADSFMRAVWSFVSIWLSIRLIEAGCDEDATRRAFPVFLAELEMHDRLCR
ncbi:acyl-CoA dehydrogenase family protein [Ciceribacter sp. L1K23]|uniref:acyl-CoA dehydrogenase family protein n=1 Tax=Ciceribacter sp. L1K23 TaxID=2820276 RepID=UPI001B811FB8|nr:acyl-CoA dehydrogenase family protein [Ciceribacter sp. L1K23]